jgi:hypothetical protein
VGFNRHGAATVDHGDELGNMTDDQGVDLKAIMKTREVRREELKRLTSQRSFFVLV